MMKAYPALAHSVYDFLENKAYSKGKGDFARKVRKKIHCLAGYRLCCSYKNLLNLHYVSTILTVSGQYW